MLRLALSWSPLLRRPNLRANLATTSSTHGDFISSFTPAKVLHHWDFVLDHDLVQPWKDINRVFSCFGVMQGGELSLQDEDGKVMPVGNCIQPNMEELLKVAVASKFGRRSETILDESIRKGTEVGPDILTLGDSHSAELQRVTEAVSDTIKSKLFPNAESISLAFCKLALYQEGGHFLEHRDTVHAPNHQGTLLVEVRSKHKGGKLTFSAVDGTTVHWHLDEPPSEPSLVRWCAFHTDVVHRVDPVSSGVRAALQFDILVQSKQTKIEPAPSGGGESESESEENGEDDKVKGAVTTAGMDAFIEKLQPYVREQSIALPLFHFYQQAYVRPEFLKSADRTLFDALAKTGHSIILTPTVIIATENDDGYDWEVGPCDPYDCLYTADDIDEAGVVNIKSSSAKEISTDLPKKVTYICTKKEFYCMDPESEHTGNDAGTEEMRYFSAAMVLLKRQAKKTSEKND